MLQKYQPFSNQNFEQNLAQMPSIHLTPIVSCKPRFCMFIINHYYTKRKHLQSLDSLVKDAIIHSFLLLKLGGVLVLEIWTKKGVMKKLLRNRGLVERGESSQKEGVSKLFNQFSFRKSCFHYYWIFFCLVNIHEIYSFMWFSFYQKIIYYEISFPLPLIFNYNFVKISLLMTFISISLKITNFFENKSQVFERSD